MADLSDFELINFGGLPTVSPSGTHHLMLDNGATTGKNTINNIVAAAQATRDNAAAIAANAAAISSLNSKIFGEANALSAVPTSYDSNFVLKYNNKQIYPGNFANSAFIIFVQSSASINRSAIFSVLIGADSSACAYELLAGSNPAHDLGFTASGTLYIKSLASSAVRADVAIFKTR